MGLEAEIWAWRLGEGGAKEEEEKEKTPHMCESIGHQPLWGPLPCSPLNFNHNLLRKGPGTADHLTLLRLLISGTVRS